MQWGEPIGLLYAIPLFLLAAWSIADSVNKPSEQSATRRVTEAVSPSRGHGSLSSVLLVACVLVGAAVLGIVMLVMGFVRSDHDETLYGELAKSGLQLIVVGVLGTALAAGWKWVEYQRDQRRAQREMQLKLFVRLVASYNKVKAIRRTLRSYGFRHAAGGLSQRQVDGFREQMTCLNTVQLDFEALKREIGEARLFDDKSVEILEELYKIESYLNRVLRLWERQGAQIDVGTDGEVVASGLECLIGKSAVFKSGVAAPRRKATEHMQNSIFGRSSEDVSKKLDELEEKIDQDDKDQDDTGIDP